MSSNITATAAAEACRVVAFTERVTSNSTSLQGEFAVEKLQSIQQTNELFAIAEAKCEGYIKAYNIAAGRTCILQQQWSSSSSLSSSDDNLTNNVTYTEFWEGEGANMDGSYTLAAILAYTDDFTSIAKLNLCANDCYVSEAGEPGCLFGQSVIPLIGQKSQSHVCYSDWAGMDNAWNELQVCAARAVFNSNNHYDDIENVNQDAMVNSYQEQRDKSVACAIKACSSPITSTSESTRLTPLGGKREGVVIIVSSLMMLFLLTYT